MTNVTRYDVNEDVETGELFISPVPENIEGPYVAYDDYAALQQKLDAIAAENAYLKDSVAMHAAGFSECSVCGNEESCETHDIVWMAKETPATDAYLNSVRADAIESVVDALTSSGALTVGDSIVEVVKLAESLRSGTHDTADKAG